ncbi:MAG: hypothetical protein N4A49_06515 [Marinifilaceae bacterium]|jgi:hypothetical protein|nr:hypothetical protein [Marinifilaceae bacterium]
MKYFILLIWYLGLLNIPENKSLSNDEDSIFLISEKHNKYSSNRREDLRYKSKNELNHIFSFINSYSQITRWERITSGKIPIGSIVIGHTKKGMPKFATRSSLNNDYIFGYITHKHIREGLTNKKKLTDIEDLEILIINSDLLNLLENKTPFEIISQKDNNNKTVYYNKLNHSCCNPNNNNIRSIFSKSETSFNTDLLFINKKIDEESFDFTIPKNSILLKYSNHQPVYSSNIISNIFTLKDTTD